MLDNNPESFLKFFRNKYIFSNSLHNKKTKQKKDNALIEILTVQYHHSYVLVEKKYIYKKNSHLFLFVFVCFKCCF